MNKELFEKLLYEEESATLDFKIQQYQFFRATDDEKSEILKDILGFANAWRRAEAYILIGVEEVRGGRSNIVGLPATDHLDDHSLQQFVNNLTNQPVLFHYEAFGIEGKQIGIIKIDKQMRPIYLKRDYGRLKKEKVYVRRGSSTDPSKPATIEEIAQMRLDSDQSGADLMVQFSHLERDDALGTEISWDAEHCGMPENGMIPDLSPVRQLGPLGIDLTGLDFTNRLNANFFRETAYFEFVRRLFKPVRLLVKNIGTVAANNVRIEITIPINIGVIVIDSAETPERPERKADILSRSVMKNIRPALSREPGEVEIVKNSQEAKINNLYT